MKSLLWILAATAVVCVAICLLLWVPEWMANQYHFDKAKDWADQVSADRAVLVNILGGLAFGTTIYFTYQNFRESQKNTFLAQDRLIIESLSKAIEQLGNADMSVRLGGMYTLARIAKLSPTDYFPIMQILTGFLRNKYQQPGDQSAGVATSPGLSRCPVEVQRILTIVGERYYRNPSNYSLDLSYIDISDAWLPGADLQDIYFWDAKLRGWYMGNAKLMGADFSRAVFEACDFSDCDMTGANLEGVRLIKPKGLSKQHLDSAVNVDPELYSVI